MTQADGFLWNSTPPGRHRAAPPPSPSALDERPPSQLSPAPMLPAPILPAPTGAATVLPGWGWSGVFDPRYNLALHRAGARLNQDGYRFGGWARPAHRPWSSWMLWLQVGWVFALYLGSAVALLTAATRDNRWGTLISIGVFVADLMVSGVPFVTAHARVRADQGDGRLLLRWSLSCAGLTMLGIALGLSRLGQPGHSLGYLAGLLIGLVMMTGFVLACLMTAARVRMLP